MKADLFDFTFNEKEKINRHGINKLFLSPFQTKSKLTSDFYCPLIDCIAFGYSMIYW